MMAANSSKLRLAALATIALVTTLAFPTHAHAIEIKRMTLSNGAVLLVSPSHQLPMVTISIAFDAGARRDPAGKAGLASLTAASLTQGTKELSEQQFNQKVDFMGSSVGISADRDYSVGGMTSLSKYLNDTFALLAGALANPGLRDSDIERRRAETVAAIKAEEEQPGYVASVTFDKMIFGDSPYGHPTSGTAESVAKLTPDDVRSFYHEHYKLGNAIIAVTGDVDTDTIKALIEKDLSGLAGAVAPQTEPAAPVVGPGLHPNLIDRNVAQATILMGSGGIARSNPDFYKIKVMNYILGAGGFSSRLVKVVRSKAGLAYSVTSAFETGKFPGAFVVSVQTKNKTANEAISLILQQLREIQEKPVTDDELEGAKKFLIGSFPLTLDRQSEITSFMLGIEVYGLGLDYAEHYPKLIGAVTKDDVQDVARKYLHPDALDLVVVANQAEAKIDKAKLEKSADGSSAQ
jgi:zinc protease